MQTKTLALLALSASATLASPFHKRQNFHHHHHGTGASSGLPMPTGSDSNAPFPAGNDTAGIGRPSGSGGFTMTTKTVSPVAETSFKTEVSSVAKVVTATDVDAASDSAPCTTVSTATATSVNIVTVTAKDLGAGSSVNAGAFYGSHSWGGPGATGGFGSSISAIASSVGGVIPTTFATAASGASASATAAPSMGGTPSGGSSTGKKGISYNSASLVGAFGNAVSWAYNWGDGAAGLSGVEYVPMCWGSDNVNSFSADGATHALSFNEPDLPAQANIDPTTAAQLHKQVFTSIRASGVKVGSPAITNGGGSMGITWLQNFFSACGSDCPVDFVAYHWYGNSIDDFESHTKAVISAAAAAGINSVWATEFAPSGSSSDQATFMSSAVSFLDSNPSVERYAAFMASDGTLLSGSSLNSIGQAYASG